MKTTFVGDKVSGLTAMLFCGSILPEVARRADTRNKLSVSFYGMTFDFQNAHADEWIAMQHYVAQAEKLVAEVVTDGNTYLTSVEEQVTREAEVFEVLVREVSLPSFLSGLSSEELIATYNRFVDSYTLAYALGAVTFIYAQHVSEKLADSLLLRYPNAAEIIGSELASGYVSFMLQSEHALLEIAQETDQVKQAGLVADYIEQYFYIDGNYRYTAVLTPEVVLQKAREALKHQGNVAANGSAHAESLSQEELACIEILKRSEVIQDVRKKLNLMGSFGLSRFLDEAVARTGVEQGLALRAFWNEYENILLDRSFAAVLGRRTSATAVYENGETAYLEAVAITPADQATSSVSVIKGTPASKGCVTGRVVVVRTTDEFHKVEVGGVLVAEMTRPDFVAVMKKASAIVTDEGGLTCHAAIVARELGKPCIVGTKVATQVLKDGDTVEVNAATGMITVLKRVG